jgi:peptide subunit release factor 1 (eRF1)
MYCILVIDLDECYLADVFSDGEVVKLFADTSMVPKKQGQGGQSQPRYQANRSNEIVHWFKSINEVLKQYDRQIILGINWIHYKKFLGYLNTYNREKIAQQISAEYCGLAGIYDVINRLENAKRQKRQAST